MPSSFQSPTLCQQQNRSLSLPRKNSPAANEELLLFGRIPYAAIRPQSPNLKLSASPSVIKKRTVSITTKRRASSVSLNHLLSRRKSLQTTALAVRRQSLWMNLSKNAPVVENQTPLPSCQQDPSNLTRKKLLRLCLVFSYLFSISLFAIALATFYGFFWSGSHPTTTVADLQTTSQPRVSPRTNLTRTNRVTMSSDGQ